MSAIALTRDEFSLQQHAYRVLAFLVTVLVVLGIFSAATMDQLVAYLVVLAAAVLPTVLWVRMGATGIPVIPAMAICYVPYYAFAAISSQDAMLAYTPWEVVRAALTVAMFLVVVTVVWRWVIGRTAYERAEARFLDPTPMNRVVAIGLIMGLAFWVAIVTKSFESVGTLFGTIRSVVLTFIMVACFLAGVSRAQGTLRGHKWWLALGAIGLLVAISWSSLFLVGGLLYALAVGFGYVFVSRRLPWPVIIAGLVVVAILHAGKGEMRAKYWVEGTNYSESISLSQLPRIGVEWMGEGVSAIADGEVFGRSIIERASLLHMLLRTQTMAGTQVDFLNGETYAMLPSILVPRFIDPDKPASQIGMDTLNIHYGILTYEGAASTAVGWGLLPEAYANFGYGGVIGMALLIGALGGWLARWSRRADIVSAPTLFSIAAMMVLIGVESDFLQAFSTMLQSFAAVLIFFGLYGWLVLRQKKRRAIAAAQQT